MSGRYSYTGFRQHFDHVAAATEQRRQYYLHRFTLCAGCSLLTLALLPWLAHPAAQLLSDALGRVVGVLPESVRGEAQHPVSPLEVAALSLAVTAVCGWLALWPVFAWRGREQGAGLTPLHHSLKDRIYSQLARYFDNFEFAPDGGNFIADLRGATIIPPFHLFLAEDYLKGVMHGCMVRISEAKIVQVNAGRREALFRGLVVVADISDSRVKLRRPFAGRTALISDTRRHLEAGQNMQRLPLPRAFEERFECLTSEPGEGSRLMTPEVLEALQALETKIGSLARQRQHWDSRLAYAANALLDRLSLRVTRSRRAAEMEYERMRARLDLTKEDAHSRHTGAINDCLQMECFNDKIVITLPCPYDLFEPNSLFEPALNEEDATFFFSLMETLDILTASLTHALD